MSKKTQQTLGFFGFIKKLVYRGKEQEIKIPRFVKEEEVIKLIPCIVPLSSRLSKDLVFTLNASMQSKFHRMLFMHFHFMLLNYFLSLNINDININNLLTE